METELKDYKFRRGNLLLLPYMPRGGVFAEKTLIDLHARLHDEGLWPIVFHEDTGISLLQFMNFFSDGKCLLQILATMDDNDHLVDIAGMAWIADVCTCAGILTRGVGSFAYFKGYQTPAFSSQFGEMILDYWFNQLKLDTIVGVTPEPNRAALVYVKRLGFKEFGSLPKYTTYEGKVADGVVTSMSKEDWLKISGA
jgi:RimJ/RimL family protein N-acetyltransferase